MSVIVIGVGTLNLIVPCRDASKGEGIEIGERSVSITGTEICSVQGTKLQASVISSELPAATAKLIVDTFANGAQVPCLGDVFLNDMGTIVCSAKTRGRLLQGLITWEIQIDLVQVTSPYTTPTAQGIRLSSIAGGAGDEIAYPPAGIVFPGDSIVHIDTMQYVVPGTPGGGTCPGETVSSQPEHIWRTPPLLANLLFGKPVMTILVDGFMNTATFCAGGTRFALYLERGGSDVAGPFYSNYAGTILFGGVAVMVCQTSLMLPIEDNDVLRLEIESHFAVRVGQTDDGNREHFVYGWVFPGWLNGTFQSTLTAA